MNCNCPFCGVMVEQEKNESGPNVCPHCSKLFYEPVFFVPGWMMGVVLVLVTDLAVL